MKFTDYYKKIESNHKEDFEFEVGYLITELRLKFGLTQMELAKKIGTKQPSIARMESGAELPSLRILKKIADALKIKLTSPKFDYSPEKTFKAKSCDGEATSPFFSVTEKTQLSLVSKTSQTESAEKILSIINN
jgi:transcriptional regulator with XRE-family HTH domain